MREPRRFHAHDAQLNIRKRLARTKAVSRLCLVPFRKEHRTAKHFEKLGSHCQRASVLDCASPLALSDRMSPSPKSRMAGECPHARNQNTSPPRCLLPKGEGVRRTDEGEEPLANRGIPNRRCAPSPSFYPCPFMPAHHQIDSSPTACRADLSRHLVRRSLGEGGSSNDGGSCAKADLSRRSSTKAEDGRGVFHFSAFSGNRLS
jgi:hypothetical protein